MHGDFSRLTFDRAKSYTAVWSQQGRIQLDADFNEQTAILLDWTRQFAKDLIGPAGGHVERAGFKVTVDDDGDLVLGAGHYYVAGIRCEAPRVDRHGNPMVLNYRSFQAPGEHDIPDKKPYLVILQVWERTVNTVLDATLLEPALGPTVPDTTIRSQVAWSLWFAKPPTVKDANTLAGEVDAMLDKLNNPRRPRLESRVTSEGSASDPDEAATIAGYSGLENQLYRIEIHRGSGPDKKPTFKSSSNNGNDQFAFEVVEQVKPQEIRIQLKYALPGRPKLNLGDCVEVIDESWQPFGTPGGLLTVTELNRPDDTAVLTGNVTLPEGSALLRRWDPVPPNGDGAAITLLSDGKSAWIPLQNGNGIEIQFSAPDDATFTRGDYWLISARTATSTVYGPTHKRGGAPPYGPGRYYAALAQVNGDKPPIDLRTLFTHLAWPDLGPQEP